MNKDFTLKFPFDIMKISHRTIFFIQKGGDSVTATEATNIIIKLTEEGWDAKKINEFIVFIETHKPSEDEAMNVLRKE